jgi:hypothetical protein
MSASVPPKQIVELASASGSPRCSAKTATKTPNAHKSAKRAALAKLAGRYGLNTVAAYRCDGGRGIAQLPLPEPSRGVDTQSASVFGMIAPATKRPAAAPAPPAIGAVMGAAGPLTAVATPAAAVPRNPSIKTVAAGAAGFGRTVHLP